MNIYDQAERFLKALKLDVTDELNNHAAIRVVEHFGNLEKALAESLKDKYNRLRFTPELLIRAMVEPEMDPDTIFLEQLAIKLYSLRNLVFNDSIQRGEDFKKLMTTVDVIKTLTLSQREAWTVYHVGGKAFIIDINKIQDGDIVISQLKSAMNKADAQLNSNGNGLFLPSNTVKLINK